MQKEHIRFSIFRINTIQKINVKREKRSKSFQVVGWFENFSQDYVYIYIYIYRERERERWKLFYIFSLTFNLGKVF